MMDKKYIKYFIIILISITITACDDDKKLEGQCEKTDTGWYEFTKMYGYGLPIQSETLPDGKLVEIYRSSTPPKDYMLSVIDLKNSRYCVQYSAKNLGDLVGWLLSRYSPVYQNN